MTIKTDAALIMYRKGVVDGLTMAASRAREDRRVSLAKDCGYIPGWQRGRWDVAAEIEIVLREREALLNGGGEQQDEKQP